MSEHLFRSKVWKYKGRASWFFVTLPKSLTRKIRHQHGIAEEGWGRLKTTATIGKTKWETAIWFDTKAGSYLLPIKGIIRKSESIKENDRIAVSLNFPKQEPKKKKWRNIGRGF